ncbi:MAG: MFS transporter [Deltaproteobacteria bacterium]|nr:MFS transporter [Deltaproteobacteria bacterium]
MTFITVHLKQQIATDFEIGVIHASYYAGILVSSFSVTRMIQTVGHIRVIAAFCGVTVTATLLQSYHYDVILWSICRFFAGYSLGAFYIGTQSWITAATENHNRGFGLAVYTLVIYLAQALSQELLFILPDESHAPFILSALIVGLAGVPALLIPRNAPSASFATPGKFRHFLRIEPFGTSTALVSGLVLSAIYSFGPAYAFVSGVSAPRFMGSLIIGGAVLQWPIGKLSDKVRRRKVLYGVILFSLLPVLYLLFAPLAHWSLYLAAFFAGGFIVSLYPIGVSMVYDYVKRDDIVPSTSALLFAYGIGSVVGPVITSHFTERSVNLLFLYLALSLLLLFGIGLITREPKYFINEKPVDFIPVPRSPVAVELESRVFEEKL